MTFMGLIFVFRPELVLWGFSVKNPEIIHTAKIMLRFIACFLLFDGLFIVYSNAIRAAGDTLFSMIAGTSMAILMQALPSLVLGFFKINVWIIWVCIVIYIMTAGTVFFLRYRGGKWTRMKVIEDSAFEKKKGASA
jgi:MATE family multidrug resistance protein